MMVTLGGNEGAVWWGAEAPLFGGVADREPWMGTVGGC